MRVYLEKYSKYIEKRWFSYLEANQFDLIHIFNRPRLVLPVRKAAPQSKITLSMHNDMFNPEKINPEEAKAAIDGSYKYCNCQ